MATLQDLAKQMEAAAKELPGKVNEVAKKVATGITEYLATETPVDTSRALSNWQVGLGGPVRYGETGSCQDGSESRIRGKSRFSFRWW